MSISSTFSTTQPRWPRTRPPRTWNTCTAASSSSSARAKTSASVASGSTIAVRSSARLSAAMSSRSRAAVSKSSSDEACFIRRSRRRTCPVLPPAMKSQNCSASARCSSGLTRPTQGAEHLSMYPSRQGRPDCFALRNTPAEQVRTGNTRSIRSTVSRMAHAWAYGPK